MYIRILKWFDDQKPFDSNQKIVCYHSDIVPRVGEQVKHQGKFYDVVNLVYYTTSHFLNVSCESVDIYVEETQ